MFKQRSCSGSRRVGFTCGSRAFEEFCNPPSVLILFSPPSPTRQLLLERRLLKLYPHLIKRSRALRQTSDFLSPMEGSTCVQVTKPAATVVADENTRRLATHEQSLVDRFCYQYLQLESHLDYPDGHLLKRGEVQDEIFRRICADQGRQDSPPRNARFELRTLKELARVIQASIEDDESDQYVCGPSKLRLTPTLSPPPLRSSPPLLRQ